MFVYGNILKEICKFCLYKTVLNGLGNYIIFGMVTQVYYLNGQKFVLFCGLVYIGINIV